MGFQFKPTGNPQDRPACVAREESTTTSPTASHAEGNYPGPHRMFRSLTRTASHGLVHGLASTAGGAIVTGLIWWHQR